MITDNGLKGAYTVQKGSESGTGMDLLMQVSH